MRLAIFVLLFLYSSQLFSQTFSESDIKDLARQINSQLKEVEFENGIILKGCLSMGRTLIYQYEVPELWIPPADMKEDLISDNKKTGAAKTFYSHNIHCEYQYYRGNSLVKKVSIKSNEFSPYNLSSGKYISLKDHPKAKEVNMKIKVPDGWEVKEGERPNNVKMFVSAGNTYLIQIRDNVTFFSRKQIRETLQEDNFADEIIQEASSLFKNAQVIEHSLVTVDTYPTLQFKIKGELENSGFTFPAIMVSWVVFYEDKIIALQAMGIDNSEFRLLENLFTSITNSVIFPEQYE